MEQQKKTKKQKTTQDKLTVKSPEQLYLFFITFVSCFLCFDFLYVNIS